ncbi:MAG: 2OG-Fe(II) oxygenase [Deltaproteobacteria bacterium]|nr:2OG-Fe(II) oxygenase [Deltaproteobacteria bacterium]
MRDLYHVWPSTLTTGQVDKITEIALRQTPEKATVFSSAETMQGIRSCTVRWLEDDWIQSLLWSYVEQANHRGFNVAIDRQSEMQFTEYTAEQGGHYGWHHDVQWNGQSGLDRKLSVTVQLSGADEYEGGDFEFEELKTNADFRSKGTVLVFPSYLRHRIHPVTAGTRRALVAWFFGPRWT